MLVLFWYSYKHFLTHQKDILNLPKKITIMYSNYNMPEGPEVIITTQYLMSKINHAEILSIKILSGRYLHTPIKGLNKLQFPLEIKMINSKGKLLWFELESIQTDKIYYLMNTLGLTGEWSFKKSSYSRIMFEIKKNDKIIELFYHDKLKFGTFEVIDNETMFNKRVNKLAPDVLKTDFTPEELVQLIEQFIQHTKKK